MRMELIDKNQMGYENKFNKGDKVKITEHTYLRTNLKKHTVYTVTEVMPVSYPTLDVRAYLYPVINDKTGGTARFDESQIQPAKRVKDKI